MNGRLRLQNETSCQKYVVHGVLLPVFRSPPELALTVPEILHPEPTRFAEHNEDGLPGPTTRASEPPLRPGLQTSQ